MSDPRKFGAWDGIGGEYVTYKYDTSIVYDITKAAGATQVGLAVALKSAGTVGLTIDGEMIEGKLDVVEDDGYCQVQVDGYCTLPLGASATATPGKKAVGALGASSAHGYIRDATTGDELKADAEVVDATDTTAVVVDL